MSEHPLESLSAYLDGELQAAERMAVEAHLADCPGCRKAQAEQPGEMREAHGGQA